MAEAVPGHRQKQSVDIAEIVDHLWGSGTWRKLLCCVADLASEFVPDLRHFRGREAWLDIDPDLRVTGTREGFHIVDLFQFLDRQFQPVRDFELDLFRAGARVGRRHNRRLDGEIRILELAKIEEAGDPADQQQEGSEIGDRLFLDGEGCKIQRSAPLLVENADLLAVAQVMHASRCNPFTDGETLDDLDSRIRDGPGHDGPLRDGLR